MNLGLKDAIAVVTGASKGIGEAVARLYDAEGAKVILLDIDEKGRQVADSLQGNGYFIKCDVSKGMEVEKAFREIKNLYGEFDILVNNAGIQTYGSVTESSEEVWDLTINVNLKSIFLCSKYAIPLMLKRDHPVVVNVSSVQALICQESVAAYVASKSAILGLTKSIAVDYAPKLRCVAVCPGAVDTPMFHEGIENPASAAAIIEETKGIHALNRISTPEEIADFIVFLSSKKASFTTGQYYRIDGGIGIKIEGK